MKKYIIYIVTSILLIGCTIETLSNGDFDGYWHVTAIEDIVTGETTDISQERMFWAVEGLLLQVRYFGTKEEATNYDSRGFYLRFSKTEKELILDEPYINGWHEDWGTDGGDTPLEDITQLKLYGIYQIPERFTIEKLTSSKMILASGSKRLFFTKQ